MQTSLSAKPTDDPCDDVALAPDVAHVVPSEEELSSVLHLAARHRLDAQVSVAPDVTSVSEVQPTDPIVRPVLPRDILTSEDRAAHHIAPPVDAMIRPEPANDIGRPDDRRRKRGPVTRAFLALLSTLIIGLGAATWKSYGDGASKMVAGLVTQPVVASSRPASPEKPQPEKSDIAAQPASPAVPAGTATAASDQPASTAQAISAAPPSAASASSDQAQLLQSMASDLATLRQQLDDLKAEMAQVKASQQQTSHNSANAAAPGQRARTSPLPPRPVAAQTRKPIQPGQPFASSQAAVPQPAVPQVATAPYRSAPQAAAGPIVTTPYYGQPQRYVPPPPPEFPPQATAEPVDQEYRDSWTPRPPMPVR